MYTVSNATFTCFIMVRNLMDEALVKSIFRIILPCVLLCIIGCENPRFRSREKGALAGGALGAGLGAIVGNQVGNSGAGIAIGSAIGAISGGLVGNSMDAADDRRDRTDQHLNAQARELEENRRLIDELRKGGADVRETDRGVVVNLPDVLFEFGRARLTSRAADTAQDIAKAVSRVTDRRIIVEGHTDSVGSAQYNEKLSHDRARSVADALVDNGVQARRITTRGFGESHPVASNSSDEGRRKNRRVEVIIQN